MNRKDRIAELEAEVLRLRDELDLIERAEKLEAELADLKRRIATLRPDPSYPRWAYPWAQTPLQHMYTTNTSGGPVRPGLFLVGESGPELFTSSTTGTVVRRDDDPPDMGVPAAV